MPIETILLVTLLAVGQGPAAGSNDSNAAEVGSAPAIAAAREVMVAASKCTLITLDATGHPQARVMDPFPPEEDMTVWMATNRSTRKVTQIEADPRVTLSCFDPDGIAYVTLLGRAELVDDASERQLRFKPEWKDFYDDEHRGMDYVLIRLVPHRLEMVSLEHGIAADPKGWRPFILDFPQPR